MNILFTICRRNKNLLNSYVCQYLSSIGLGSDEGYIEFHEGIYQATHVVH